MDRGSADAPVEHRVRLDNHETFWVAGPRPRSASWPTGSVLQLAGPAPVGGQLMTSRRNSPGNTSASVAKVSPTATARTLRHEPSGPRAAPARPAATVDRRIDS